MSVIVKGGGSGKSSGLYVWKKHSEAPMVYIIPTLSSDYTQLALASDDKDLSTVDASFFVGAKGAYLHAGSIYLFEFSSDSVFTYNYGSSTYTRNYTYDPTIKTITFSSAIGDWQLYPFSKTIDNTFLDFVASDSENTYPHCGVQDGYYYEFVDVSSSVISFDDFSSTNVSPCPFMPKTMRINMHYVPQNLFCQNNNASNYDIFFVKFLTRIEINTLNGISDTAFYNFFYGLGSYGDRVKMILNCSSIGMGAFHSFAAISSYEHKVFITSRCTHISASSYSYSPFYNCCSSVKLYLEADSVPSGFNRYWNYCSSSKALTTMYGVKLADFEAL